MAKEEFRSSPEVRTGFVKGNTFGYRPVRYSVINGEAIFEGDIVLGSVDEMERLVAEVKKEKILRPAPSSSQGHSSVGRAALYLLLLIPSSPIQGASMTQ
jgi:hypothetical protein